MAKNVKINGVTYENVPQVEIPLATGSGNATFYDTGAATAAAGDILTGKTAFGASGSVNGSMPNNGAINETISTKAAQVAVPAGYHSGSGKVQIASAEQEKIIAGNIKSGVTILGVQGSSSVVDTGDGNAAAADIVSGKTAYVGGQKVTGTMTAAVVSQDSTTKVLTIS